MANPPHIDLKALDGLIGIQREGKPDMLTKVVYTFFNEATTLLDTLQEAVTQGDAAALERAAHSFKSGSSFVGASMLAALCEELEDMGRLHAPTNVATSLTKIEAEYAAVKEALTTELQRRQHTT